MPKHRRSHGLLYVAGGEAQRRVHGLGAHEGGNGVAEDRCAIGPSWEEGTWDVFPGQERGAWP